MNLISGEMKVIAVHVSDSTDYAKGVSKSYARFVCCD